MQVLKNQAVPTPGGGGQYTLNKQELLRVLKELGFLLLSTILTFAAEYVTKVDLGQLTPFAVLAVNFVVRAGREWIADNSAR